MRWIIGGIIAIVLGLAVWALLPKSYDHADVGKSAITPESPESDPVPAPAGTSNVKSDDSRAAVIEDQKRSEAVRSVESLYGPVLPALKLTPSKYRKLYAFLVEREQSKIDVGLLQRADPRGLAGMGYAAVEKALAEIDQQLPAEFEPETYRKIKQMLDATLQLIQVEGTYISQLRQQGYGLSPEQSLTLAVVLRETYSPSVNPDAKVRDSLPLNPESQLSSLDEQAMERLSKVLSPPQLKYVSARIAAGNRSVRNNSLR